jgi:tRNA (mo5U34)-methyltransferase
MIEVQPWTQSFYTKEFETLRFFKTTHVVVHKPTIEIGLASELHPHEHERLLAVLHGMKPWKKGPFCLFGHYIDAEWRSDWKWARIQNQIKPLKNKVIADIGCNNGYYMMRMHAEHPKHVMGFEPYLKHRAVFELLQGYAHIPHLHFDSSGVEGFGLRYPNTFDAIFCLGILYHHTDPIGILQSLHKALRSGGQLILDCQGIPGHEHTALTPKNRYANAKGIWFLPTLSCLQHWIHRAGFRRLKTIYAQALSTTEQRTTAWAPIDSLAQFLDPQNPHLTQEGYPAPYRFYITADR